MNKTNFLTEEELYLFNIGEFYHSYLKFGAHILSHGTHFCVWAPNALKVSVVGDFNHWCGRDHVLQLQGQTGVWTLYVPGLKQGEIYKYEITTQAGEVMLKADPYAFQAEKRPATASRITSLDYIWHDEVWLEVRKEVNLKERPMLIYEVHLGSWKIDKAGKTLQCYQDLGSGLLAHVKSMGYTHIELLPLMEHPYDGSWGYQVTGYFAATSRYGTPQQLMSFIDQCHQEGIGVILDWVPGHFCKDRHGLGRFDGTPLYEEEEHEQWGTYKFNFERTEIWSFLISNALFWFDCYHIDGLRVDGVSSMLYLDYGKEGRPWKRNARGGRENLFVIEFFQRLNEVVFFYYPHALMIAEEATDWPLVSWPKELGGLGFNYKWNMGWMNDTLSYMELNFDARRDHHRKLTFSLMYAFSENFILPLSHDEVVHGKKSLLSKMPGTYEQKFAGLRSLYCYFLCHPGKKLFFMGGELAQFIEWRFAAELDWLLLEYEMHRKFQAFIQAMNQLYLHERFLWEKDHDWSGFSWIDADNSGQSVLVFCRYGRHKAREFLVILVNFQPLAYEKYRIGVPRYGVYKEIFNTDCKEYGGTDRVNPAPLKTQKSPWHNQSYSLEITVPPLSAVIFKRVRHTHDSTLIFSEEKDARKGVPACFLIKRVLNKRTWRNSRKPKGRRLMKERSGINIMRWSSCLRKK